MIIAGLAPLITTPSRVGRHPTSSSYLECDDFLEIMQCIEDLLQGQQLLCPAFPNGSLHSSNYQVVIAHDLWLFLGEERCENMLDIVLMSDEQITVGTVPVGLVQREQLLRIFPQNFSQLLATNLFCLALLSMLVSSCCWCAGSSYR